MSTTERGAHPVLWNAVANSWKEWSVALGLKENNAKSQFYHKKHTGRTKLLTAGIDENQITSQPKILGVVLVPSHGRRLASSEKQRLDSAKQVLHKVRCLPVNLSADFVTLVLHWHGLVEFPHRSQSEPHLRSLLLGHHSSLYFRSAADQIMSTRRTIRKTRVLPYKGMAVSSPPQRAPSLRMGAATSSMDMEECVLLP